MASKQSITDECVEMLRVLLGRIPATDILNNQLFFDDVQYPVLEAYMQKEEDIFLPYSGVECRNMAENIGRYLNIMDEPHLRCSPRGRLHVFYALFETANLLLKMENTVVCRYETILLWRKLVREIGEDIPVAAKYALTDILNGNAHRQFFDWDCVTNHNNRQLNALVKRGISEHHFHLFASLPYFQIAWLNLMNRFQTNAYRENLRRIEQQLSIPHRITYIEQLVDNVIKEEPESSPLENACMRAAVIRLYLILKLAGRELPKPIENLRDLQALLRDPTMLILNVDHLQSDVIALQETNESPERDYALLFAPGQNGFCNREVSHLRGERWFLYTALRDIYHSGHGAILSREEQNLFYLYLRFQVDFRKKIVQTNRHVGFDNFQKYEKRKLYFVPAGKLATRMAVREPLKMMPYLLELETRISPSDTAKKNCIWLHRLDDMILSNELAPEDFGKEEQDESLKKRFYYVFHFIKRSDTELARLQRRRDDKDFLLSAVEYRHYHLRARLREQADALLELRERYSETAMRVRGIDAASQEIGCRPEIFGPIFRRLSTHHVEKDEFPECTYLPILGKTYHAGEDFLDVVDGLRAIDEAIRFLNLDCGDRIGHALALGVNVAEWYQGKGCQISLSTQDHLDNIAWMYHALKRYKIEGCEVLKDYLLEQFRYYFSKCYLSFMDSAQLCDIMKNATAAYRDLSGKSEYRMHDCNFDIDQYYKAWALRGDHPELYRQGFYNPPPEDDPWDMSSTNFAYPTYFDVRYIPEVALLNYFYQYDPQVKSEGAQQITVDIPKVYIDGCALIQKMMQMDVARRGLSIETNPSSNVLIGTFRNYEKHPLTAFYNRGLVSFEDELECPQLNVSINTDDSGVFFTNLGNEYALMANALENSAQPYPKTRIYQWLDDIRKMGNEQGFPEGDF